MKTDPSDVLILIGSVGVAAFAGHFGGAWYVVLAIGVAVLVLGILAMRRGN